MYEQYLHSYRHYITSNYITLRCITLHFIMLHYITRHYTLHITCYILHITLRITYMRAKNLLGVTSPSAQAQSCGVIP